MLLAQAGAVAPAAAPGGWQFTLGSYLWTPRTEIDLTVGPVSRSTTIDFFSDVTDHLNFGFTGHFEATLAGVDRAGGSPVPQGRKGRDDSGRH